MEFRYTPNFLGASRTQNNITGTCGSFEATSEDLPLMKATVRDCMPSTKPTLRLEYAARAFGYRTAAAMQNALKAATPQAPLVMTPLVGPLDPDREKLLLQGCDTPTDAARDAALAISRAVIKSRGKIDLPWDEPGIRQHRHVVHPLSPSRDFSFRPDLAPPDLRTLFLPTSSAVVSDQLGCDCGDIPNGWGVEYMTESNTTDEDLARMQVALVGVNAAPEKLPVFRNPEIESNRVRATMILKDDKQELVGFVTFTFTIAPVSETEADWLTQRSYSNGMEADDLAYFRTMRRCNAWKGHLHIEATGDRYQGEVSGWSSKKFEDWVKDDDHIKAAFSALMDHEFQSIGYALMKADENEEDSSLGQFMLDLTTNGYHIGETNYDEFAAALHRRLKAFEAFGNDSREGTIDRNIEMALCTSVYDYAYEALADVGIKNPWGEEDIEEDFE